MHSIRFKTSLIVMFLLLLLAASCASAFDPALTLEDKERGTTVNFYPLPDPEDKGLLFYGNDRFGYSLKVPVEIFTEVVMLPDNGDGIILASKDGNARFRVSGGNVMTEDILKTSFEEAKQKAGKDISFEMLGDGAWELSWWEDKTFFQRKFLANEEVWCECEISYPASRDEGSEEPLDDLTFRAIQSLGMAKE